MNCLESSLPFLMKNLKENIFKSEQFIQGLLRLAKEKMIRVKTGKKKYLKF